MNNDSSFLKPDKIPEYTPSSDERILGLLAHLITFISSFIGPLIIYLIKKDSSEFVADHAKASLNFQLTMGILSIVLIVSIIGILLLWIVGIVVLIFVIIATVRAAEGKPYSYPFTIRFIK